MEKKVSVVLATASYDRIVKFWDATTGMCQRQLNFQDSQINAMGLSADKQFLAAVGNQCMKIFDIGSGGGASLNPLVQKEDAHSGNITAVGFLRTVASSPAGGTGSAAGSFNHSTHAEPNAKPEAGSEQPVEAAAQSSAATSAATPTARSGGVVLYQLFTAGEDGHIRIWDFRPSASALQVRSDINTNCHVNACCAYPTLDAVFAGDQQGRISAWSTGANANVTGSPVSQSAPTSGARPICDLRVGGGESPVRSVTVCRSGTILCAALNSGQVACCVVSTQGQSSFQATGTGKQSPPPDSPTTLTIKVVHLISAHRKYALHCTFSPNSRLLATCGADYAIHLFGVPQTDAELKDGTAWKRVRTLSGHQRWVWACSFSSDSRFLVSVSSDQSGRLWDIEKGKQLFSYNGHHKPVVALVLDDTR